MTLRERTFSVARTIGRKQPWTIWVAMAIIALTLIMVVFGHWLAPHDPSAQNLLNPAAPMSREHWLGTDDLGRDVFSRMLVGAANAVIGPLVIAAGAMLISVLDRK